MLFPARDAPQPRHHQGGPDRRRRPQDGPQSADEALFSVQPGRCLRGRPLGLPARSQAAADPERARRPARAEPFQGGYPQRPEDAAGLRRAAVARRLFAARRAGARGFPAQSALSRSLRRRTRGDLWAHPPEIRAARPRRAGLRLVPVEQGGLSRRQDVGSEGSSTRSTRSSRRAAFQRTRRSPSSRRGRASTSTPSNTSASKGWSRAWANGSVGSACPVMAA